MSSAAEARGNPIFILSALCCAFLSIILFYDIHFLRDLEVSYPTNPSLPPHMYHTSFLQCSNLVCLTHPYLTSPPQ